MLSRNKRDTPSNPENVSKLSRREILLLEEYKNCTQVLMNENRIAWIRFNVFLSISSALITVWVSFTNSGLLTELGQLLTGLLGFLVAITWLSVSWKAHAYNDLWASRLQKIENEKVLSGILKTFNKIREKQFYKTRPFREKHPRLDTLRPFVPYMFSCFWLILLVNVGYPMASWAAVIAALLLILVPSIIASWWTARKKKRSGRTKREPKK